MVVTQPLRLRQQQGRLRVELLLLLLLLAATSGPERSCSERCMLPCTPSCCSSSYSGTGVVLVAARGYERRRREKYRKTKDRQQQGKNLQQVLREHSKNMPSEHASKQHKSTKVTNLVGSSHLCPGSKQLSRKHVYQDCSIYNS